MSQSVVIIGAGHAGGAVAGYLRQYGYEGAITMIGAEPYLPYQRPPLSKAWLKGEATLDDLYLRGDGFYGEHGIDVKLNTGCESIGRGLKAVALTNGETISYDHLVLATGSKPRPLPFDVSATMPWYGVSSSASAEAPLFHLLRTLDDAEALKAVLQPGQRLGLIGAGYVGLEVAASARYLGCDVTVFEREDRILARVASPALSDFFTATHLSHGVKFVTGCSVTAIGAPAKDSRLVHLSDGTTHTFDVLLVGIGALPADDLARMAGLDCDNGVVVDAQARTSDPAIFAIGDVTSRALPFYPGRFRLESVPNALEQAKQAAAAITGHNAPVVETPWFWSDQYSFKLQIAGLLQPGTRAVLRGDVAVGTFSVFHLDTDNRLQTAECVNRPADFMAAKQLIARGIQGLDAALIADPDSSLKPLLAR